jgi:uncharacterized protein YozE (UPF0346 family)
MDIEDNDMEDSELEIMQLEEEDGSIVDAAVIADMELDDQYYVALQIFDEDSVPEELEVTLAKITPDPDDDDFEIVEFLEEGEEFDKVAAAFDESFKAAAETEDKEE